VNDGVLYIFFIIARNRIKKFLKGTLLLQRNKGTGFDQTDSIPG